MYEFTTEQDRNEYTFCYDCNHHYGDESCNNCTYYKEDYNMSSSVIMPLLEYIESSDEKWEALPSEYENLKKYYIRKNGSLNGFFDWFKEHFIPWGPKVTLKKDTFVISLLSGDYTLEELEAYIRLGKLAMDGE